MRSASALRILATVALSVVIALASTPARATAFSTDQSDVWWNSAEAGWGIQFVQTGSTIFATMYVYSPSGQPVWYVATMEAQSTTTWSGDLLVTSGPWFGTVPFNPTWVTLRTVGKMSWKAQSMESGTLTYTVDNVPVTKTLTRQTLRYDDQAGKFAGVAKMLICNPVAPPTGGGSGTGLVPIRTCMQTSFQATFAIDPTASGLTAVAKLPFAGVPLAGSPSTECTFTGDYAQYGRFGKSRGTFACTDGTTGTHTFDLMSVQKVGEFTVGSAQLSGKDNTGYDFWVTLTGIR